MGQNDRNPVQKRTRQSSAKDKPAVKKKTTGGKTASTGKTTATGRKTTAGKKSFDEGKENIRRKPSGKVSANGRKPAAAGKKPSARTKTEGSVRSGQREESASRMNRREEERARRRAERERKVRRQKIVMTLSVCVILVSVIGIAVFCMSSVQVSFRLFQGERAMAKEDYAGAQSAFEKALEADDTSVKAYRRLADRYYEQQMLSEAEQILYTGWEKTQNETLLRYYCTVILNQAVAEINAKNCTLATVDKCIQALEYGAIDAEAQNLLLTCHKRLFQVEENTDTCMLFFDADAAQDTCSYTEYEQLLRRMLTVYQARPSEQLKDVLKQYAVIDMPYVRISVPHLETYLALLTEINGVLNDADIAETAACLSRAKEIGDYFGTAFAEFEAGNYAYARELISEESYQQIRDDFIAENSGYWEGSTYIPVSREQLVLHREEGKVTFSFLDEEEYENHRGIIKVWGTKQEDDGVQRSGISYLPAEEAGADSHIEYTVQYLYSNVKIKGKYVPQMNYRFDTKTTTAEGVTTNAIGDWGGENEWEIDY